MSIFEKLKENLGQSTERLSGAAEKIVDKGIKLGSEGLEITKEVVANLSEKTSEITALARLKYDIVMLTRRLDSQYLKLGKMALEMHNADEFDPENEVFQNQLNSIAELDKDIRNKQQEYEELRKAQSGNYVVNQLSDDLAAANATIEKVIISAQSNVVEKLLKEILLPKEALISAIKRDDEMIIPDGNTRLKAGDQVVIIGKKEDVEKVAKRFAAN